MNYHSDQYIMGCVREHYNEALEYFPEDRIVCLVLQGSQNYGLDTATSDIDTKLIVTPTFRDIALNKQPISSTHVRANEEHIDFKDLRLYCATFKKQNLNFLEILFSPYYIVNPLYKSEWDRLVAAREEITHYDPKRAVMSMMGLARTKYKQLEHESPSHEKDIERFGYSPKELCHLYRIEEYLERYIAGEPYADCLVSKRAGYLKGVKAGNWGIDDVRWMAKASIDRIEAMCAKFVATCNKVDEEVGKLLDDVQYNIMKIAIEKELL